jgi:hypothetical protein
VLHFTGYGAWEADQAAQHAANSQPASTPEGQAQQAMAEEIGAWRAGEIDEQEFDEDAAALLQYYYDTAIAPEVPAALTDDGAAERTIKDLLSFERTAGLLAIGNRVHPSEEEAFATIRQIILEMIARAQTDCAENHHLAQVPRMIALDREYTLTGGQEIPLETIMRCWSFALEFDSTIVAESEGGSFTYELKATVPLKASALGVIQGSEAETYPVATGEIPANCPETDRVVLQSGTPGTFKVTGIELGIDAQSALKEPQQLVKSLEVDGSPGELPSGPPYETYAGEACEGASPPPVAEPAWLSLFGDFHQQELTGLGSFAFKGFEPQSGATIGTRTYLAESNGDSESTVITLTHTPPAG